MTATLQIPQPEVLGCVTSTNEVLAARWRNDSTTIQPFTSIVARHQRSGRGRLGRAWSSPVGKSLLISILIPTVEPLSQLPLATGTVVRQLIDDLLPTNIHPTLKWPNDVLVNNQKIAGILCEHLDTRDEQDWVIAGIGINLTQSKADLGPLPATSIRLQGGQAPDVHNLAHRLVEALAASHFDADDYRKNCSTLGQAVKALLPDNTIVQGIAHDITPAGALVIRTEDNQDRVINAADVTLMKCPTAEAPRVSTVDTPRTVCEECQ